LSGLQSKFSPAFQREARFAHGFESRPLRQKYNALADRLEFSTTVETLAQCAVHASFRAATAAARHTAPELALQQVPCWKEL